MPEDSFCASGSFLKLGFSIEDTVGKYFKKCFALIFLSSKFFLFISKK